MFLKQAAQNATTQSRTLQELANFRVEYEETKENLSKKQMFANLWPIARNNATTSKEP